MDNKYLEKSILSVICYFDIFEYPLTLLEIWQWLFIDQPINQSIELSEIKNILENSDFLADKINSRNGFYFLKNRDQVITTRLNRYSLANDKNKIAQRGVKVLRFLPFVKLVGLCNNSGNNNIRPDSDIDLFIITSKNRLFTARFLVTIVISLMRLRRHGRKITNRLCLSFYVSEADLNFSKIKIIDDDVYLIYWIANLFPLYDRRVYDYFLLENKWIDSYLPNHLSKNGSSWRKIEDNLWSQMCYKIFEVVLNGFVGNQLENLLKKIQFLKMSKNNKSLAKENDSRVIINNTMLKFHENDRRLFYRNIFLDKVNQTTQ